METGRGTGRQGAGKNLKVRATLVIVAGILCSVCYVASGNSDGAVLRDGGRWTTKQMRVTAYCPCTKCCGKHAAGITASGHKVRQGDKFVAADRQYTFGTEMVIPGYNNNEPIAVLDRGGAIKGDKLDVFFNSHTRALEWGVQILEVKIRLD